MAEVVVGTQVLLLGSLFSAGSFESRDLERSQEYLELALVLVCVAYCMWCEQ